MSDGKIDIRFGPVDLSLRYPLELDQQIRPAFSHFEAARGEPTAILHLRQEAEGRFELYHDRRLVWRNLTWPGALGPIFDEVGRILAGFSPRLPAGTPGSQTQALMPPALGRSSPRLTIGMATLDDYDGVYFTLQALRLYHPEVADEIEYLVVDNNPEGACGAALRRLGKSIPGFRYVPVAGIVGTAVRDFVMREASSEFVMCLDCHVLVTPGAVARLIAHFEQHPASCDLLQGPLVSDDLTTVSTHWQSVWREGMYGSWALDEAGRSPDAAAFDIPMQGLGLYACRQDAWPGFNSRFRGFGGEEGYIHEKFRQRGGRTLCLPFLRWIHRFERPLGAPYEITWHDRIRNYMIGYDELGLSMDEMLAHFRAHLGPAAEPIIREVKTELAASASSA